MEFSEPEYEWVCNLQKGDYSAFNAIYNKYFQPVYFNVFKLIGDAMLAEDIVQEVFVALWEKRSEIIPDKSIGGWLFVLSYNKSVNILRQKLRESLASEKLVQSRATETVDETIYVNQLQLLSSAILRLSPQKQKVVRLCKLQGKTYDETAKILNLSKHTVKEYLSTSISSIKAYFEK